MLEHCRALTAQSAEIIRLEIHQHPLVRCAPKYIEELVGQVSEALDVERYRRDQKGIEIDVAQRQDGKLAQERNWLVQRMLAGEGLKDG